MSDRLRLGLVQCGSIMPALAERHGDYPLLFERLLAPFDVEITTWDVRTGAPMPGVADQDGWLVSGSASSTYDDLPWIPVAESFLRGAVEASSPLVGICFGHQLLAQALGGRVEKSPAGWGIGAHQYEVVAPLPVTGDAQSVRMIASHQDQVTELPDGAEVFLRTDHCPIAGYTLGADALAIQPHPEFDRALSHDLTDARRHIFGDDLSDSALASLESEIDDHLVATWIADFFASRVR